MASRKAVVEALKVLCVNFAGEASIERVKLWMAALVDVPDDDLARAVAEVVRTRTGEFLPPVAVVRQAALRGRTVDLDGLIRAIDRAGSYNALTGWAPPRIEAVRELFGDDVAEAYGLAGGGSRLFSGNATTREIAARDFAEALRSGDTVAAPLIAPVARKALGEGAA